MIFQVYFVAGTFARERNVDIFLIFFAALVIVYRQSLKEP